MLRNTPFEKNMPVNVALSSDKISFGENDYSILNACDTNYGWKKETELALSATFTLLSER